MLQSTIEDVGFVSDRATGLRCGGLSENESIGLAAILLVDKNKLCSHNCFLSARLKSNSGNGEVGVDVVVSTSIGECLEREKKSNVQW